MGCEISKATSKYQTQKGEREVSLAGWPRMSAMFLFFALTGVALLPSGCRRSAVSLEEVRFAVSARSASALVFVAMERGLFEVEGIKIVATRYPTGKQAIMALRRGEVDFVTAAEAPAAIQACDSDDFRILAVLCQMDNEDRIVARRDSNISKPEDLRGKRIGTQEATAVHFFLHLFLTRHLIDEHDTVVEFGDARDLVTSLAQGRIDAISVRDPQINQATTALGTNAVVFSEPGLYRRMEVLIGSVKVLRDRPRAGDGVVRALIAAQEWAHDNPEDAIVAVAKALSASQADAQSDLREANLRVNLSQELLVELEEVAQWALHSGTARGGAPDFLRIVYPDLLDRIDPDAVTFTFRKRGQP